MTHLIGFYREDNAIKPVYSDTGVFHDSEVREDYRAIICPLKFFKTSSEWLSLANLYSSHPVLDEIIKESLVCHTSSNDADLDFLVAGYSCGVLMHAPVSNPQMCRTGVFVIKHADGEWVPLVVYREQRPYIVECKGVGSGTGGFASIHHRRQARTATKLHVRITGAMVKTSVEKEFQHLMAYNAPAHFLEDAILPFACVGFDYVANEGTFNLGLILRLAPSNIRYSYLNFGDFKHHQFDGLKGAYPIFSDINRQLFSLGFRHDNLNSNNLCYAGPKSFVFTDFEELSSIYKVPASLDAELDDFPVYLLAYPFRYIHGAYYKPWFAKQFYCPKKAQLEVSKWFSKSHDILTEYYEYSKVFIGLDYFSMDIGTWLSDILRPNLECQRQILLDYISATINDNGPIDFNAFIAPYVSKLNVYGSDRQLSLSSRVGELTSQTTFRTLFIFPHDVSVSILRQRICHIESLLRHIQSLMNTNAFFRVPSTYRTPFPGLNLSFDYWDIYLLMFPFLGWVAHWHYFLSSHYSPVITSQNFHLFMDRLSSDLCDVKALYHQFRSDDGFISYITNGASVPR